ncbi:MAG: hypothetical protein DI538_15270 [Azospira oryzae]|jgi:CheY-like chemotaxis protein|nr:MAG: hypothetical protein DI538_15270 [Azospira oryzae]
MNKKKIIVAEDDPDLLWLLVEKLLSEGYDVQGMPDGMQILEGRCSLPDLFILDKEMDPVDGESITRYLRYLPASKDIPIFMLSGNNSSKSAIAAGVNHYFEKPFDIKEVMQAIEQTFEHNATGV